jgi:hypothetical protein
MQQTAMRDVLREPQSGLTAIAAWCEHWNIRSMKIRLRPSTSLFDVDRSKLILH